VCGKFFIDVSQSFLIEVNMDYFYINIVRVIVSMMCN